MQFHIKSPNQMPHHHIPCGSSIEFYVEPIRSCIDDFDTLLCNVDEMAFTENNLVLPDDVSGFLDTINCSQITPYPDYPGYVRLRRLGKMSYNWHCRKFDFQQSCDPHLFVRIAMSQDTRSPEHIAGQERYCVGPALKFSQGSDIPFDVVFCVRCPQWPEEANHWPFRRRRHGWPTIANIRKIVQSGCHVVNAKHPDCRNDELQCRLSFSVAEVILLQSWTPVQQIVYHMLRFFAKRELIRKDCPKEDEVLSAYHFKTLMLWSCEEMPQDWWNSLSVIEICCHILRKLSEWLNMRYCPNYFIPLANLLYERMNKKLVNETTMRLNKLRNSDSLACWFEEKYIPPILERISIFTETRDIMTDFGQCMLLICEIRDKWKLELFEWEFSNSFFCTAHNTVTEIIRQASYAYRRYLQCCHGIKRILRKTVDIGFCLSRVEFSSSFPQYVKVLFSLHAANALGWQQVTYDSNIITEFVREVSWQPKVFKSKHHNFPKPIGTSLDRSLVLFLIAQGLMENLIGPISPIEFKLVSQMSKCLLGKALECEDSKSKIIAGSTLAYMAALHFALSEYKSAIELCSRLSIHHTGEVEGKEMMNAGCLLYIEAIANIIGFYLLFKHIKYDSLNNKRLRLLDLRITPEVFALYLINLLQVKMPTTFGHFYELRTPTFPLDGILITITNGKSSGTSKSPDSVSHVFQITDPINKSETPNDSNSFPNEDDIIQLLMAYSLENMESFYNSICKDLGIHRNTVDCYRAAYLYKCRKYQEVLQLCDRILDEPDLQRNLEEFSFANVMVMPPLDSYFDRDIQCLLGMHTFVCCLSPLNEDVCKLKCKTDSTFQQTFVREIHHKKLLLSVLLGDTFFVRSHYFLGRHFLARYLKVRCLIDYNHSSSELMFKFKKLKSNLPFEHVIRCFLQQKIRRL